MASSTARDFAISLSHVLQAELQSVAVFEGSQPDNTISSKDAVGEARLEAGPRAETLEANDIIFTILVGRTALGEKGSYRIGVKSGIMYGFPSRTVSYNRT